jgi:hypothetical protein
VDFDQVRKIALALPDVEEGMAYGTPAFRVRGKFLARLHDNGEALIIRIGEFERRALMEVEPDTYYITDHYVRSPYVLIRFAKADPGDVRRLFEQAWRTQAPKRLIAEFDKRCKNS